jgi:hypothetical protein
MKDVISHPWVTATSASSMLAAGGGAPLPAAATSAQAGGGGLRARVNSNASITGTLQRYGSGDDAARAAPMGTGDESSPPGGGTLPMLHGASQRHGRGSLTGVSGRLSLADAHASAAFASPAHSGGFPVGSNAAAVAAVGSSSGGGGGNMASPAFRANSPALGSVSSASGGGIGLRVAAAQAASGGGGSFSNTPRVTAGVVHVAGGTSTGVSGGGGALKLGRRDSLSNVNTSSAGSFPPPPASLFSPTGAHSGGAAFGRPQAHGAHTETHAAAGSVASAVAHARRSSDATADHSGHHLPGGAGPIVYVGPGSAGARTATAGAPRRAGSSMNLSSMLGSGSAPSPASAYQRSPSALGIDTGSAHLPQLPAMALPHAALQQTHNHGGGSNSPTHRSVLTAGTSFRGIAISTNVSAPIGPPPTIRPSLLTFSAMHSGGGAAVSPAISGQGTVTPVTSAPADGGGGVSVLRRQPSLLSQGGGGGVPSQSAAGPEAASAAATAAVPNPSGSTPSPAATPGQTRWSAHQPETPSPPMPVGAQARSLRAASVPSVDAATGGGTVSPHPPLQRTASGSRGGGMWPSPLSAAATDGANALSSPDGAEQGAGAASGSTSAPAAAAAAAAAAAGGPLGGSQRMRLLSQGSIASGTGVRISSPLARRDRTTSAGGSPGEDQAPAAAHSHTHHVHPATTSPTSHPGSGYGAAGGGPGVRSRRSSGVGSSLKHAVLPSAQSEADVGHDPFAEDLSSTGSPSPPPHLGTLSPHKRRGSGEPLTYESLSAMLPPPRFVLPGVAVPAMHASGSSGDALPLSARQPPPDAGESTHRGLYVN